MRRTELTKKEIDELGVEGLKRGLADGTLRVKQSPCINSFKKQGRNEPCKCGSGIKYKKCHGLGK